MFDRLGCYRVESRRFILAHQTAVDCAFKSTKKLKQDILGWLNKPNTPGFCGFPLTNLHKWPVVDFVPQSNPVNTLNLLCICTVNLKSVRPFLQEIGKFFKFGT